MRIAKYIAASGICSRREAERYIIAGRVAINGTTIDSPANNVSDDDIIAVDGKKIALQTSVHLWLYHKPAGLVTSNNDELGRTTIFETLHGLPRVISVGRLDLNSEGLLLLTNSGELARILELPSSKFDRIYKVRARGDCNHILAAISIDNTLVCEVDGIKYTFKHIKQTRARKTAKPNNTSNHWFEVTLQEGKNREIRRVFEHYGLQVGRLIRTHYAGFSLGDIKAGRWQEADIPRSMLDQVKPNTKGK